MIPILIIIGFKNVGKTTLINKLLFNNITYLKVYNNKNDKYFLCSINKFLFLIKESSILSLSYKNNYLDYILNIILSNVDIVLLLIDINYVNVYKNLYFLNYIKKFKKYIFILINKFDNNKFFYNLILDKLYKHFKYYFISVLHNYNIIYFIKNILNYFCKNKNCLISKSKKIYNILILFLGNSNSGKLSLINSIIKKNINFSNFFTLHLKYKNKYFNIIKSNYNKNFYNKDYINVYKMTIISNIIVFIIDPLKKFNKIDLKIYNFLKIYNLSVVFIINKSDLLNLKERKKIKNYIKDKLILKNFYLFFSSSVTSYNINYIKYILYKVYKYSSLNINTSKLNKVILKYFKFLRIYYNNIINFNYIHQGGKNPILIIIHSKSSKINNSYKLFLEQIFIKKLNIKSVPVKIKF